MEDTIVLASPHCYIYAIIKKEDVNHPLNSHFHFGLFPIFHTWIPTYRHSCRVRLCADNRITHRLAPNYRVSLRFHLLPYLRFHARCQQQEQQ